MADLVESVFHTIVFPPQLPQYCKDDCRLDEETYLLELWEAGITAYAASKPNDSKPIVQFAASSRALYGGRDPLAESLERYIRTLEPQGSCIVWVRSANSGLLIFREDKEAVIVEAFESAATNQDVMKTAGPLHRQFPGVAVRLKWTSSRWAQFCIAVQDLATRPVQEFIPITVKQGKENEEARDSTNPAAVTSVLYTILVAVGDVDRYKSTSKIVYDEICWDAALLPWRRHPLWLVLRVGLQRFLCRRFGALGGHRIYKNIQLLTIAHLCSRISKVPCPEDWLSMARTKLGRRMDKLLQCQKLDPEVHSKVLEVLQHAQKVLEERWLSRQTSSTRIFSARPQAVRESDRQIRFQQSSAYLEARLSARQDHAPSEMIVPEHPCPTRIQSWQLDDVLSALQLGTTEIDVFVVLADFENRIPSMQIGNTEEDISKLYQMFKIYEKRSSTLYLRPESGSYNADCASARLLALSELWLLIDRAVTHLLPCVLEFSADAPDNFFRHLRLPDRGQMERLKVVEDYLRQRRREICPFVDKHMKVFAGRYFESDQSMKYTLSSMHNETRRNIDEKKRVFEQKKEKISSWLDIANQRECEYCHNDYGKVWHSTSCFRCQLEQQAVEESIEVYEEPLPRDPAMEKWVIFEALCPSAFRVWREIKWTLLNDHGRPKPLQVTEVHEKLESYSKLQRICSYSDSRITLASTTKSFEQSHYSGKVRVHSHTIEDVCKPNALHYSLYDNVTSNCTGPLSIKPARLFFQFPGLLPQDGSYTSIIDGISGTSHTSNQVISRLEARPASMDNYEFDAFMHLRSGESLQWLNILHALATPNLKLSALPSEWLITQAALEVGTSENGSWRRTSHQLFNNASFCRTLFQLLTLQVDGIKANWQKIPHMRLILTLLIRLETLSEPSLDYRHLRHRIRKAAFSWIQSITSDLQESATHEGETHLRETRVQAAMLCRATYAGSQNDNTIDWRPWWSSGFILSNRAPACVQDASNVVAHAVLHDWAVAHKVEETARKSVLSDGQQLNDAIASVWEPNTKLRPWTALDAPNNRWMRTCSVAKPGHSSLQVHVDILAGTLLINGAPQGSLPASYSATDLYRELFQDRAMEVFPATAQGFQFAVASTRGQNIFFGLDSKQLIIGRSIGVHGEVEELVPRSLLSGDLPYSLVDGQCHWLRLQGADRGQIQVVPKMRALESADENDWVLSFSNRSGHCLGRRLLELATPLVKYMSDSLGPFEDLTHMVPTVGTKGDVTLHLPRSGLMFALMQDGQMQIPALHAQISERQSIGTLVGLETCLVVETVQMHDQLILVPHGTVVVSQMENTVPHQKVTIKNERVNTISLAQWAVNPLLNRLDSTSEPQDLLLQAHLHAVTTSDLPDPLTRRSGIEEAVSILCEVERQMYWPLTPADKSLLNQVSMLPPDRRYYPAHLQSMQQSSWSPDTPSRAQQTIFGELCKRIIRRSNELGSFHPHYKPLGAINRGEPVLTQRALLRERRFNVLHARADCRLITSPAVYAGRDRLRADSRLRRVFEIANLTVGDTAPTPLQGDLALSLNGCKLIQGFHKPWPNYHVDDLFRLDVRQEWGFLFHRCLQADVDDSLLFQLPILAYQKDCPIDLVTALASLVNNPLLYKEDLPRWPSYQKFQRRENPSNYIVHTRFAHLDLQPRPVIAQRSSSETLTQYRQRADHHRIEHQSRFDDEVRRIMSALLSQWPAEEVRPPPGRYDRIVPEEAANTVKQDWTRLWTNLQLSNFLSNLTESIQSAAVASCLNLSRTIAGFDMSRSDMAPDDRQDWGKDAVSLSELIQAASEPIVVVIEGGMKGMDLSQKERSNDSALEELSTILDACSSSHSTQARGLKNDLRNSHLALRERLASADGPLWEEATLERLQQWVKAFPRYQQLLYSNRAPPIARRDFLHLLATECFHELPASVKSALVHLALDVVELQWRRRLQLASKSNDTAQFQKEISTQHFTWDFIRYPEWLILEIEMNVWIREEQYDMALSMIQPPKRQSSVFQLQMGAGKSSLIVPMMAATLANGNQLARIMVTKPLLHSAGQVLRQRLGRLLERCLLHVPFTRNSPQTKESMEIFDRLHRDTCQNRGVVLCLPEHLQSFQLCGIQAHLDGSHELGSSLLSTQQWFRATSRDILDECDFILSTRTQLIYPSGAQIIVDGGARRWRIMGKLLRHILDRIQRGDFKSEFPGLVTEDHRPHGFPFLYLPSEQAELALCTSIAADVLSSNAFLPLKRPGIDPELAKQALTAAELEPAGWKALEAGLMDDLAFKELLTLRGMLRYRILSLALTKRWNIEYGLDLNRCEIAVPYLARGQPSLASEYGHPDVALILTYFAYYHQGLSEIQLRQAIENLQLQNEPTTEWTEWTAYAWKLPKELKAWDAINLEDSSQMKHLHASLRYSVPAIHFFLDVVVFPRAAREFERKLVSSSWDLPLCSPQLTTGFSGTNDNAALLPTSIRSQTLSRYAHTNAEVLHHLLQPRNRDYWCVPHTVSGKALDVEHLIKYVSQKTFDVLLDAGALILEMQNAEVAQKWLSFRPDKKAVAFMGSGGRLEVLYPGGRREQLSHSPFEGNLEGCLLYLDEENCRGVDTRLAPCAKAALTLGPSQPKEKTVQAAMRMRGLAQAQSVSFVAPPIVDESIRRCCQLQSDDPIDSHHVIQWSIMETMTHLSSQRGLYLSQRKSFLHRKKATELLMNSDVCEARERAVGIAEPEKRSLRELYATTPACSGASADLDLEVTSQTKDGSQRRGQVDPEAVQERQISREIQRQQQTERPPLKEPLEHSTHADVQKLAQTGDYTPNSSGFQFALDSLFSSDPDLPPSSRFPGITQGTYQLLVTKDFLQTVRVSAREQRRQYSRSVRYMLWTRKNVNRLAIISPFEANSLLATLRQSSTHLLVFEAPRARFMVHDFYSASFFSVSGDEVKENIQIPTPLLVQLHFYAGSTYLPMESESAVREFLRSINRQVDPEDHRRSDTDVGSRVTRLWRDWLDIRTQSMDTTHPASLLIDDKPWDAQSLMFKTGPAAAP